MLYFFFLLLSGSIFVNRSLEIQHLPSKSLGHYLALVVLMLVGVNCFTEMLVLFFSISLNLTTRELYFSNTFPYLKSYKNLDKFKGYKYMNEADLRAVRPRNPGFFDKYAKLKFMIYNPFYRSFWQNWVDNFKRNCKKKHTPKSRESGFDKNGFSIDSYSYVEIDESMQAKSAIKMNQKEDSFFGTEASEVTSFSDTEQPSTENLNTTVRSVWSEADSPKNDKHENKENQKLGELSDNSMQVEIDELDSETQIKLNQMIQSFKTIENSALNLRNQYYSSLHQPIMSIFQIHCPQREKSLAMMYQKMIRTKKKLFKNHKQSVQYSAVEPQQ